MIVARDKGKVLAVMADEDETMALGRLMARALPADNPAQNIFLSGPLGAGKTTLVRGLAESLPGGDKAQVSSPSFNIVNYYPTKPECAHFDLYRLEGHPADESLMEAFHAGNMLVVVEWGEYLEPGLRPDHSLYVKWTRTAGNREVEITATGEPATKYLETIAALGEQALADHSR